MKTPVHEIDTFNTIQFLQKHDSFVEITETSKIKLAHSYFKMGLKGTNSKMYLREGVWKLLQEVSSLLPSDMGLYLFDGYRTVETQKDLFLYMKSFIEKNKPHFKESTVLEKTREFVADPFNPLTYHKMSHPTGGAIDLGLYDLIEKQELNMGTPFDDPSPESSTFYYEVHPASQTATFNKRRLLLRDIMISYGFTNYSKEWWHYDLGNFSWAKKMNCSWHYSIAEKI